MKRLYPLGLQPSDMPSKRVYAPTERTPFESIHEDIEELPKVKSGSRVTFVEEHKTPRKTHRKADHARREPNAWVKSLKEFNKNNETYCIPKRGSTEYNHVRELMKKY